MKTYLKAISLLLFGLVMQVCTTTQQNLTSTSRGTFAAFDVDFLASQYDVSKEQVIHYETGSKITIPAQAFVDADGKPVKGKVKVDYREFHNAAQIITAGITMRYDSGGVSHSFESAGMFDIRATQGEKPVFLAKGKQIQVDLASYKGGAYNFYYLREDKRQTALSTPFISQAVAQDLTNQVPGATWQLLETSQQPAVNEERVRKLDSLEKLLPVEPIEPTPYDEKAFAFDFEVDVKDFPELREFEGLIWQYAGEKTIIEGNPQKNEWIFDHNWTNIQLEDLDPVALQYKLVLTSPSKRFESVVRPALKGKALADAQAMFKDKMTQYQKTMQAEAQKFESAKAERNYLQRLANFRRSFKIQEMGIYNCDIIYRLPGSVPVFATLNVKDVPGALGRATVFMVIDGNVMDVQVDATGKIQIPLSEDKKNKIIAILGKSDQIAVFSSTDFAKLNYNTIQKDSEISLALTKLDRKIVSVKDLEGVLARL